MSKYPFLPLDIDAYFGATRHLSTEQHGAYILLLMEAWRRPNCTLPDDDEKLARLAGVDLLNWHTIKSDIMAFWEYDGRSKAWVQKRLKKERKYVASVKQKKRDAATSRWKTKKKGDANAYASAMQHSPSLSQENNKLPTEQGESSEEGIFYDDLGVRFSSREIGNLINKYPLIDIRKKLREHGFVEWAYKQDPALPKRVITNFFKSQNTKADANQSLENSRVLNINSVVRKMP